MAKPVGHSLMKLEEARAAIAESDPLLADEVGYYPPYLCQIALPNKRCEGGEYKRTSGKYRLTIQTDSEIGVPYGIYPRGILAYIATVVTKQKGIGARTRVIELGDSMAEFMERISGSRNMSGGRLGNIRPLKEQLLSLISSRVVAWSGDENYARFKTMEIASEGEGTLLWHPNAPSQPGLFQSRITLGEPFYEDLARRAVPVDRRTIQSLWGDCLAFDVYTWATYRAGCLAMSREQYLPPIPWISLHEQFGPDIARIRDFKRKFEQAVRKVQYIHGNLITIREDTPNAGASYNMQGLGATNAIITLGDPSVRPTTFVMPDRSLGDGLPLRRRSARFASPARVLTLPPTTR